MTSLLLNQSKVRISHSVFHRFIFRKAFNLSRYLANAGQGARAYFFHAVFHDWPEDKSLEILANLAPAMKRGYSRVLICDSVIPPVKASVAQTVMDVSMMALLSAEERTKEMWDDLLGKAGFKIIKYWSDPRGHENLIEAELA